MINGGYTYDRDLVHRLPEIRPGTTVTDLDPATVTAHLDPVDSAAELAASAFLAVAREVVGTYDCDVVLRAFQPVTAPALLLDNREARHERTRAGLAEGTDGLWADILGSLRAEAPRAQLVLNHLNPLVRRAATVTERGLAVTTAEALYGQALLLTHAAAEGVRERPAQPGLHRPARPRHARPGRPAPGPDVKEQ